MTNMTTLMTTLKNSKFRRFMPAAGVFAAMLWTACDNSHKPGKPEADSDLDGDTAIDTDSNADDDCTPNTNECGPDGCGGHHLDCAPGEACTDGSCQELVATFLATFEGGNTTADVGEELIDNRNGGTMSVVANPFPSESNGSSYVLRVEVPAGTSVRSEYHSQQLETDEKAYIYVWRQHYEENFLAGADVSWLVFAQWKTWPCGEYDGGYGDVICDGGGIFNDIELINGESYEVRFRADPDCNFVTIPIKVDTWDTFVLEMYWTNTKAGYYRLFRNGVLLEEQHGVKTLFDRFPAETGECDMYWGLGLYATWVDEGSRALIRYIDDMAIYDLDDGVDLAQVCPACES